ASPIRNRRLRSASIGCLGKRGDRPASLHARCQADSSARSPESWRQETMFVAIHRATAYVPLNLGGLNLPYSVRAYRSASEQSRPRGVRRETTYVLCSWLSRQGSV